jgi:anti-sigma factor RsiW
VTYQHRSEAAPDHARHEPMLIARMDDPDLDQRERADVERWLANCGACRELHADLVSLRQSLVHDLPTPRRPRDFRLSAAMLEERPRRRDVFAPLRRLLAPETPWATQLAGAALAIGLGFLLASGMISSLLPGGGRSVLETVGAPIGVAAPAASGGLTGGGVASAVSAPPSVVAASSAPSVPASLPLAVSPPTVTAPPTANALGPLAASQGSRTPRATAPVEAATPSVPPGPSPAPDLAVALAGLLLALGGGGLLLGRWSMRRRLL